MAAQGNIHLASASIPTFPSRSPRANLLPPWVGLSITCFIVLSLALLDVFEIIRLRGDSSLCQVTTELARSIFSSFNKNSTVVSTEASSKNS